VVTGEKSVTNNKGSPVHTFKTDVVFWKYDWASQYVNTFKKTNLLPKGNGLD